MNLDSLNNWSLVCHEANMSWWMDLETGVPIIRNKAELIMLVVTELAECVEGLRKDVMDDALPHRTMEEVELADALIRIFDYAGAYGLDLEGAVLEKLAYNKSRPDHSLDNRRSPGGKKF